MITQDDTIVCDSCHRQIVGKVKTVTSTRQGWGKVRKSETHYHLTSLDCSNAKEVIKVPLHNPKWKGYKSD